MYKGAEDLEYSERLEFRVTDEGIRLDVILSSFEEIPSRSFAEKLILEKRVFVNGKLKSKSYKPKPGETIEVFLPKEKEIELIPYDFPLRVVYEDEHLIVVAKPSGLVVHPAYGHYSDTLVNALVGMGIRLSSIGAPLRPGIVHRLDKDTSGLIMLAKTEEAHIKLAQMIKSREIKRVYLTLACGNIYRSKFSVEAPITRHRQELVKMTVDFERGKYALTHFDVLKNYNNFTFMKATLSTGRTHQIRVHLSSIGHPVAGDPIYGGLKCSKSLPLKRLFLHAYQLEFSHPITGAHLSLEDPLPAELEEVIRFLESQ
ncbi:MAG: RluA family pseudouridine synthase [Actinobacteria bacterium]|nr:RluA family pseudouridine synthase [Actinomycetota bacterium]